MGAADARQDRLRFFLKKEAVLRAGNDQPGNPLLEAARGFPGNPRPAPQEIDAPPLARGQAQQERREVRPVQVGGEPAPVHPGGQRYSRAVVED